MFRSSHSSSEASISCAARFQCQVPSGSWRNHPEASQSWRISSSTGGSSGRSRSLTASTRWALAYSPESGESIRRLRAAQIRWARMKWRPPSVASTSVPAMRWRARTANWESASSLRAFGSPSSRAIRENCRNVVVGREQTPWFSSPRLAGSGSPRSKDGSSLRAVMLIVSVSEARSTLASPARSAKSSSRSTSRRFMPRAPPTSFTLSASAPRASRWRCRRAIV